MLVTEDRIAERGLVKPECQIKTKNSTCDLTVGKIFPMGGQSDRWIDGSDEFWLKPSHMVSVVSAQQLRLPDDVTGLATLVTSLTREGILCLNVGVVDPGYDGPLGATLVNFSDKDFKIFVGQRLFRVLFIEHEKIKKLEPFTQHPIGYSRDVKAKSRQQFSETFLDVKGILKAAEARAWRVVLLSVTKNIVPWLALVVGILALFNGNFEISWGSKEN